MNFLYSHFWGNQVTGIHSRSASRLGANRQRSSVVSSTGALVGGFFLLPLRSSAALVWKASEGALDAEVGASSQRMTDKGPSHDQRRLADESMAGALGGPPGATPKPAAPRSAQSRTWRYDQGRGTGGRADPMAQAPQYRMFICIRKVL
jgi:hypothetical protein